MQQCFLQDFQNGEVQISRLRIQHLQNFDYCLHNPFMFKPLSTRKPFIDCYLWYRFRLKKYQLFEMTRSRTKTKLRGARITYWQCSNSDTSKVATEKCLNYVGFRSSKYGLKTSRLSQNKSGLSSYVNPLSLVT
jgi:hypothetical protein